MRQTHINIHIKTIGVEHREHVKIIKTQNAIQLNTRITLFDILIQRSNNEGFFMQISTVIRQLKRMTSLTKITCPIRREEMVKGMTCKTNLVKELITSTVNKIINGNNAVFVTKSHKALEICE